MLGSGDADVVSLLVLLQEVNYRESVNLFHSPASYTLFIFDKKFRKQNNSDKRII